MHDEADNQWPEVGSFSNNCETIEYHGYYVK